MKGIGNAIRTELIYSTVSLFLPPIVKQSVIVASLAMSISTLALSILAQNPIGIATASLQTVVGVIGLLELSEADRIKKLISELGAVDQLAKRVLTVEKEQQERIGDILRGEQTEGSQLKVLQEAFFKVQANEQQLHQDLTKARQDLLVLQESIVQTEKSLKEVEEENKELKEKIKTALETQEVIIGELKMAKEASTKAATMEEVMRGNLTQAQRELGEVKKETDSLANVLQTTKTENLDLQREIAKLNAHHKEVARQLEESKRIRQEEEAMQDNLLKKLQQLELENSQLRKNKSV